MKTFNYYDIYANELIFKFKKFNCYFICNKKHKKEKFKYLIKKLIDCGSQEFHFCGRYKNECENYADDACVELDIDGIYKIEDMNYINIPKNFDEFVFWISTGGMNVNDNAVLIYDDEKIKDKILSKNINNSKTKSINKISELSDEELLKQKDLIEKEMKRCKKRLNKATRENY